VTAYLASLRLDANDQLQGVFPSDSIREFLSCYYPSGKEGKRIINRLISGLIDKMESISGFHHLGFQWSRRPAHAAPMQSFRIYSKRRSVDLMESVYTQLNQLDALKSLSCKPSKDELSYSIPSFVRVKRKVHFRA